MSAATWMLDELAHAGPEHLEADYVAGYDRKSGYDPADDVAALVRLGTDATSTVVDFGAGTGRFALAAGRAFGRVVAVDVAPAMVRHLRERVAEAGAPNVTVVQSGFLGYEHEEGAVDAVFTRNALHQLPDFWKAVAIEHIARMLEPGGVLRVHDLVYDFEPSEAQEVLERWFDGAVDDPAVGYTRAEFVTHVRTEHSTFRWLLEPMFDVAGFEIAEVSFRRRIYGTYTCIRR